MDGRLVSVERGSRTSVLEVLSQGVIFNAEAPASRSLVSLQTGSTLRITGICAVQTDVDHIPKTFRILIPFDAGVGGTARAVLLDSPACALFSSCRAGAGADGARVGGHPQAARGRADARDSGSVGRSSRSERRRRSRQPRQERVPGQHEPRDSHPDERHHRHDGTHPRHRPDSTEQREYLEMVQVLGRIAADASSTTSSTSRRSRPASSSSSRSTSICATASSDVLKPLALRAQQKGLELVCRRRCPTCPSGRRRPGRAAADPRQPVGNAIKFTEQGEVVVQVEVESATADDGDAALQRVRDTGIGIPPRSSARSSSVRAGRRLDDPQIRRHRPGSYHFVAPGGS